MKLIGMQIPDEINIPFDKTKMSLDKTNMPLDKTNMPLAEMNMPLAERDIYLLQIDQEIKNRKQLLIKKKKELEKKEKVNNFLEEVKKDYANYYNYILNEKQNQYKSLMLLKEYMDDLMQTNKLVDNELRTAKHDQKDILREIDNVKNELDSIVNEGNIRTNIKH